MTSRKLTHSRYVPIIWRVPGLEFPKSKWICKSSSESNSLFRLLSSSFPSRHVVLLSPILLSSYISSSFLLLRNCRLTTTHLMSSIPHNFLWCQTAFSLLSRYTQCCTNIRHVMGWMESASSLTLSPESNNDEIEEDSSTGYSYVKINRSNQQHPHPRSRKRWRGVVLRLYGGKILDKSGEQNVLKAYGEVGEVLIYYIMAQEGLGPKIYGVFTGGRLGAIHSCRCSAACTSHRLTHSHNPLLCSNMYLRDEFYLLFLSLSSAFQSRIVSNDDLLDPAVTAAIARKFARIHSLNPPFSKEPKDFLTLIRSVLDQHVEEFKESVRQLEVAPEHKPMVKNRSWLWLQRNLRVPQEYSAAH